MPKKRSGTLGRSGTGAGASLAFELLPIAPDLEEGCGNMGTGVFQLEIQSIGGDGVGESDVISCLVVIVAGGDHGSGSVEEAVAPNAEGHH